LRAWLLTATAAAAGAGGACIDRVLDAGTDGTAAAKDSGTTAGGDSGGQPGIDAGTDAGTDAGPPQPMLDLGTGCSAFMALADGGEVLVHTAGQGGFHIYVSLRIRNMDPGDTTRPMTDPVQPVIHVETRDPFGTLLADQVLPTYFTPVGGVEGLYEVAGYAQVMEMSLVDACADVLGETLTVTATVTDATGASASAAHDWIAAETPECTPGVFPTCE
jgi:hypothetical protein